MTGAAWITWSRPLQSALLRGLILRVGQKHDGLKRSPALISGRFSIIRWHAPTCRSKSFPVKTREGRGITFLLQADPSMLYLRSDRGFGHGLVRSHPGVPFEPYGPSLSPGK